MIGNPNYFAYTTNAGANWTASTHSSTKGQRAIEYDNNGQLIASHDYQYSPFETQMAIPPESIAEKIYHLIWG